MQPEEAVSKANEAKTAGDYDRAIDLLSKAADALIKEQETKLHEGVQLGNVFCERARCKEATGDLEGAHSDYVEAMIFAPFSAEPEATINLQRRMADLCRRMDDSVMRLVNVVYALATELSSRGRPHPQAESTRRLDNAMHEVGKLISPEVNEEKRKRILRSVRKHLELAPDINYDRLCGDVCVALGLQEDAFRYGPVRRRSIL